MDRQYRIYVQDSVEYIKMTQNNKKKNEMRWLNALSKRGQQAKRKKTFILYNTISSLYVMHSQLSLKSFALIL